ncbi:hypothetical protein C5167_036966 [Papaver somniferum]|uniref:Uncharacterized protein n=1 Tax=Papaver somniferum TaxID=3469 RepID=A0A4Y7I543_PAPSO|nr:hypothetical protein C5167_036966 [Papaver somniferum]
MDLPRHGASRMKNKNRKPNQYNPGIANLVQKKEKKKAVEEEEINAAEKGEMARLRNYLAGKVFVPRTFRLFMFRAKLNEKLMLVDDGDGAFGEKYIKQARVVGGGCCGTGGGCLLHLTICHTK